MRGILSLVSWTVWLSLNPANCAVFSQLKSIYTATNCSTLVMENGEFEVADCKPRRTFCLRIFKLRSFPPLPLLAGSRSFPFGEFLKDGSSPHRAEFQYVRQGDGVCIGTQKKKIGANHQWINRRQHGGEIPSVIDSNEKSSCYSRLIFFINRGLELELILDSLGPSAGDFVDRIVSGHHSVQSRKQFHYSTGFLRCVPDDPVGERGKLRHHAGTRENEFTAQCGDLAVIVRVRAIIQSDAAVRGNYNLRLGPPNYDGSACLGSDQANQEGAQKTGRFYLKLLDNQTSWLEIRRNSTLVYDGHRVFVSADLCHWFEVKTRPTFFPWAGLGF